jgi:hypothetical protein
VRRVRAKGFEVRRGDFIKSVIFLFLPARFYLITSANTIQVCIINSRIVSLVPYSE